MRPVHAIIAALSVVAAVPAVAQQPETKKVRAERDPSEVVCKKFPVTGSLVATKKICATRADWSKATAQQSRDARGRLEEFRSKPRAFLGEGTTSRGQDLQLGN